MRPSKGVQADRHGRMILESPQRLPISAMAPVPASDRLPVHSGQAGICQTNKHAHYHESSVADQASLRILSRSPLIADQTVETPR